MNCPHCGKEMDSGVSKCPHCQAELAQSAPAVETAGNAGSSVAAAVKKKYSKKRFIIPIVSAIVLLLIGVIVFYYFYGFVGVSDRGQTGSKSYYNSKQLVYSTQDFKKVTTQGSYTLMIYMIGSNLESKGQAATEDILEMVSSGVDLSNVNVVIYAGGANSWGIDISKKNTNILKMVEKNGNLDVVSDLEKKGAQNMGEASTFTSFLEYAYSHYPADHYGLICWDHGAGVYGFGYDEVYNDILTLEETEKALAASPFGKNQKIDWVGYDACLMGSLEVAEIWAEYADYLVASEEIEPGFGWDYSFLSFLNKSFDAKEITAYIIDTYSAFFANNKTSSFNFDYTLSCMDLSQVKPAYQTTAILLEKIVGKISQGDSTLLHNTLSGNVREYGISDESRFYMFDLYDLANTVKSEFPKEAAAVQAAIQKAVVSNQSNLERSEGISVYYELAAYVDSADASATKSASTGKAFHYKAALPTAADFKLDKNQLQTDDENAVLHLTDAQSKQTVKAYYTVLRKLESGAYTPVMSECALEIDKDNNLSVSLTPNVIVASSSVNTQTASEMVFRAKQLSTGEEGTVYSTERAKVLNAIELLPNGDNESVQIKFTKTQDDFVINHVAASAQENTSLSDKSSINLEDWGYLTYFNDVLSMEDTPYTQWEGEKKINLTYMSVGKDVRFSEKSTDQLADEYLCQIVLVDCNGKEHATQVFDLKNMYDTHVRQSEVKTENGKLIFDMYKDHAELYRYEGTDTVVELPEEVEGLKLITIGSAAFAEQQRTNKTLQKIVVPDTVNTFKQHAFTYCMALEQVNIPEAVTVIPDDCFYFCKKLAAIELHDKITYIGNFAFGETILSSLDFPKEVKFLGKGIIEASSPESITFGGKEEGKYFKVVNGCVLTKDGTELVCGIFEKDNPVLSIPAGVKYIDDYAFCCALPEPLGYVRSKKNIVHTLELPDGLEVIGDFAFAGFIGIEEFNFPDSLRIIGDSAFISLLYQEGETLKTLQIGPNLASIKHNAFGAYGVETVEVDKNNRYYSSVNGKLMNKGGDVAIEVFNTK
ncbi:MAG: leucine-rich repeat protein [Clostridia bacterium]|nr:leucine-rich repeat protein [Clostridia bacterium]